MIEFVYQIGKDTPEQLAEELYTQQEAMSLKLDTIGVETIAKNIRQSVDLAVNRRISRTKHRNSIQPGTSRRRADTANSIFEVAGDKRLQKDPEYQKM